MDNKKNIGNIAYLRFVQWNNSFCNLSFHLDYKCEEFGEIVEDIQTIRQQNETVDALLQHTNNKIIKLIQNKLDKDVCFNNKDKENEIGEKNNLSSLALNLGLYNRSKPIKGDTILNCLERYKHLTFSILNIKYQVIVNAPLIEDVKLPDIIYSGHSVQPANFKCLLTIHKLSAYSWYKSMDKLVWELVGDQYNYQVKDEDMKHYLKFVCVPKNEEQEGPKYEVVSENPVTTTPEIPECPFENRHKFTREFLNGNRFRMVSYNTLSCRYAKNQFEYCPIGYLSIDYRKQLLLKELVGYKADIICLQEVDNKIYSFYFRDEFKERGYGSIYNKKGNRIPEGLAIFYNTKRFSFVGQGQIVFNNEIKTNHHLRNAAKLVGCDKLISEIFMKQATSMQYCKLKDKTNNQLIIVGNTHLYYHPDAANIRLLQTIVCLDYLKMLYNKEIKNKKNVSVIFCGDFNSTPSSDVYKFVTKAVIKYDSGKNSYTTLFHPFNFDSACGTPEYTNYTEDFKACLDYIFYDNKFLTCTQSIPFPAEDILSKNTALPSVVFPSDHLALVADLEYK